MKKEYLSAAMNSIDVKFIEEAENFDMTKRKIIKRPLSRLAIAAIIIGCLVFSGAAYAGATLTDWESVISFFDKDGKETQVIVSDKAFFKELPDGLPVPGDGEPMIPMKRAEVEALLGFEFLGSTVPVHGLLEILRMTTAFSSADFGIWYAFLMVLGL